MRVKKGKTFDLDIQYLSQKVCERTEICAKRGISEDLTHKNVQIVKKERDYSPQV